MVERNLLLQRRRFQQMTGVHYNEEKEYGVIGFGCNMCDWSIGYMERWQALPIFGRHNVESHVGTMHAHLVEIRGWRNSRRPSPKRFG